MDDKKHMNWGNCKCCTTPLTEDDFDMVARLAEMAKRQGPHAPVICTGCALRITLDIPECRSEGGKR